MNDASHSRTASANVPPFDVCVVGHVTKDMVKLGHATTMKVGGTAYFTSIALRGLGLNVAVVTKGAEGDRSALLHELDRKGIAIYWRSSEATMVFENSYREGDSDTRTQVIKTIGTAFSAKDVDRVKATSFHLGPLVRYDMPLELLRRVRSQVELLSLDIQGMVRPRHLGMVTHEDWAHQEAWLELVDVLKADETEACIASGESDIRRAAALLASMGPKEVIVTLGSQGSFVYSQGILHEIPSWPPRQVVDPTGRGDTYMAGYLYKRLKGMPPDMAGKFGAATATLKLEGPGPFVGTEKDVDALLARCS